jgi:ABC-2 type transport system permease protein
LDRRDRMLKFIKYEIKGNYRFILGILALVLIASSIIQAVIFRDVRSGDITFSGGLFEGMISLVSILVLFGAALVAFINIVGSFKKELYDDRGYLTFTLPLSGHQILGAKLIVAFLWYTILNVVTGLYNLILATTIFKIEWSTLIDLLGRYGGEGIVTILYRVFILSMISGIIMILYTLIFIYFSMTIGKISFRNVKIGGLWFIIFLVTFSLSNVVIGKLGNAFPIYLNMESLRLSNLDLGMTNPVYYGSMSFFLKDMGNYININLIPDFLNIVFGCLVFLATGYLLDRKIDL